MGTGGGGLYDAAIAVKEILRGRSILLVEDRTDIATAAEADGVILSTTGPYLCHATCPKHGGLRLHHECRYRSCAVFIALCYGTQGRAGFALFLLSAGIYSNTLL